VLKRTQQALWRALPASLLGANPASADVPKIEPNRSVPGVAKLTELAGGLSTLVMVGAAIGFLLGLGLMAVAGSAQNVHLRERAKSGTGWALTVAVLAAGANRLLDWAWGIGTGL
jgi:hypothetical protein